MKLKMIEAKWDPLKQRLNLSDRLLYNIIHKYSEKGNAYHNIEHIMACLDEFEQIKNKAENIDSLELAIWFHDIIYYPGATDNESLSSMFAELSLRDEGLSKLLINNVKRLIMSTKYNATLSDKDAYLIHDIDMSILGKDWMTFKDYDAKIAKEYSSMDKAKYVEGRKDFLKKVLSQDRLFYTPYFHDKYKNAARRNIKQYLKII